VAAHLAGGYTKEPEQLRAFLRPAQAGDLTGKNILLDDGPVNSVS